MNSPSVLCIDDRPQMFSLRRAILEPHFGVEFAANAHTAMKLLTQRSVAAVLLEYKLEGMDAEAIAYLIKQQFPELPIILLSAYSEMPERILWLVDAYVMKSEMPGGLVRILKQRILEHAVHPHVRMCATAA
jgi:CheY-like chemotaxis protein